MTADAGREGVGEVVCPGLYISEWVMDVLGERSKKLLLHHNKQAHKSSLKR
jgi:hypothetical protein